MAQLWEVIGGGDAGGILVRAGRELGSEKLPGRLSTGALVQEKELAGNRLSFQRLEGTGPEAGWISLVVNDKTLVVRTHRTPSTVGIGTKDAATTKETITSEATRVAEQAGLPTTVVGVPNAPKEQTAAAWIKRLIAALSAPVKTILTLRAELELSNNTASVQRRLTDQEIRLGKLLEDLRAATDEIDPPLVVPPRLRLRCASPGCNFRVHTREGMGGYCCITCRQSGGHGQRCQRILAAPGADRGRKTSEPIPVDQLALIELEEGVRILKSNLDFKPWVGPENSELLSDPKWSRSGRNAIGTWVSSIIDDQLGDPETAGPAALLEGGYWISRKGLHVDQWIIFDLGKSALVSEVRVRSHHINPGFSPRQMRWQSGTGLEGSWTTLVEFTGTNDGAWTSVCVDPPAKGRWWRLHIKANWGSREYVWLHGFALRLSRQGKKDGDARGGEIQAAGEESVEEDEKEKGAEEGKPAEATSPTRRRTPKTWSLRELRRNDEGWKQLTGYQKLLMHALLSDRVLPLQDKPYIDYCIHDVAEYARAFREFPAEMGWSLDFNPNLFCELAYQGLIPTSIQIHSDNHLMVQILTPCFEQERHVLVCLEVHVSKKVRKRAKHYTMTVDAAYDDVMLGCIRQHGEGWLYRGERWVLRKLLKEGYTGDKDVRFAIHSFELWDQRGQLVAGDLGYTVGGVYVSMTGFHKDGTTGAGEVQLVLTAALLHKLGHEWFDLGQAMKYKEALGARTLSRAAWLEKFYAVRDKECRFQHDRVDGTELLADFLKAVGPKPCKEKRKKAIETAKSPRPSEAVSAPAVAEAGSAVAAAMPAKLEATSPPEPSPSAEVKDSRGSVHEQELKAHESVDTEKLKESTFKAVVPEEHYMGSNDGVQAHDTTVAADVAVGDTVGAHQKGHSSTEADAEDAADIGPVQPAALASASSAPEVETSRQQGALEEPPPAVAEDAPAQCEVPVTEHASGSGAPADATGATSELQEGPEPQGEVAPDIREDDTYEVLFKRVAIRERPSMKGRMIGILSKGERIFGTPYLLGGLPWLRLPPDAPQVPSWKPSPPAGPSKRGKGQKDEEEPPPSMEVHCLACGQAVASMLQAQGNFCHEGLGGRIWYAGRFSRVRVDGTTVGTCDPEAVPKHDKRLVGWRRQLCHCAQCVASIGWRYERRKSAPFWELAWDALKEGHPYGSAWVLIDSTDTDLGLGRLLRRAPQQGGKVPDKELGIVTVPWADAAPSKPVEAPLRSIFGQTYAQEDAVGFASFHFRSPTRAYISYSHPLCEEFSSLSDGSRPPARKPFKNVSYDAGSRTFRGTISWEPATWFGTERWEYTMVFSKDFDVISGGEVRLFGLFAEEDDEPEEVLEFGVGLHYRRAPRAARPPEGPVVELEDEVPIAAASTVEISRSVLRSLFMKVADADVERALRPAVCRGLLRTLYMRVAEWLARISTWEVVFKRVAVRNGPSTNAKIVTVVLKGDRVRGTRFDVGGVPWLRLAQGASQAQTLEKGAHAWILIDATGTSLGLGVLLAQIPEQDRPRSCAASSGALVTVSGLAGELCKLTADCSWTMGDLRVAVETATGIQMREQRLFFESKELLETSQLCGAFSGKSSVSISLLRRSPEQALWLEKVQEDWRLLAKAPEDVRRDREVMLKAVAQDWSATKHAAADLLADRDFALEAVVHHADVLSRLSADLQADREVVLMAVRRDGAALRWAVPELQADREVVATAVVTAGRAIRHASEGLRGDYDLALAAVRQDWNAFEHISPQLRVDRHIALAAVSQHGSLFKGLALPLRSDREVALSAVRQSGRALKHVAERLLTDPELALAAVGQDGEVLKDLPFATRAKREVVLAAVRQNGHALQHAPEVLRADREVVLAAVQQSRSAITHAAGKLKGDSEILLLAAAKVGSVHDLVSAEQLEFGATRSSPIYERLTTLPEHLQRFAALHTLELNNNNLAVLPRSFGRLGSLKTLKLCNNKLAALPHSFGFLSWLTELRLDFNQLKELPDNFGQLGALRILGLSYNQLAKLPNGVGQLTLLEDFNLTSNQLETLPESFGQLSALQNARLYGNQLASLPESVGDLAALHWMLLGANKVTSLPASLGNLEKLQALDMAPQCPGGHFLQRFITRSAYRSFYCNVCRGSSKAGDAMWGCRKCNYDACTKCLEAPQLPSLPESLAQLPALRSLRVVNQQLLAIPTDIGLLTSLQVLGLSSNRISSLPESILKLQALQVLELGDNLMEALPDGFGDLSGLQDLDISVNSLKALPESVGRLGALKRLNLSSNSLEELPESFGSLAALRELDLDKNQLKGLPSSFQQLTGLPKGWTYSNTDFSLSSMSSQAPVATTGRGHPLRMFDARHFS